MFSWYKCLVVGLVFSHLGFWSGNLFLIAPFPDLCLLVPFYEKLGTVHVPNLCFEFTEGKVMHPVSATHVYMSLTVAKHHFTPQ